MISQGRVSLPICIPPESPVIIRDLMATSFASNFMAADCAMPMCMGMMCCPWRPRCREDAIQAA
jgi:hypothetical protein